MSDSARLAYLIVDAILAFVIIYLVIRPFNDKRGISYLATLVLFGVLLIVTAYLTLPSLHLITKLILIIMLIGLPLYFDDIWANLLGEGDKAYEPKQKFLGRFPRVIFSLVCVVILVLVSGGITTKTAEMPQSIRITAANLPDGIIANFGNQSEVRVIVAAPYEKFAQLTADSFSAVVDVANKESGTFDLPIQITSKESDVKVIRIKPSRVTVALEPKVIKTVNVVARYTGKAANELVPGEAKITPDKVEISGSKSVIDDLTQAVIRVNVEGQSQAIEQKFTVMALNANGEKVEGVTFNPAEVQARIELVKAGRQKTVGVRPKLNGAPSAGWWISNIEVSPSAVVITGAVDVLEEVNFVETSPININGIVEAKDFSVTLALPTAVTLVDEVKKVTVKISVSPSDLIKSLTPSLSYEGLSPSLKVTKLDPATITVIISGPSAVISTTEASAIIAKLDLSAYKSAGTYSVNITNGSFSIPSSISLISFLPSAVSVTLENK